MNLPNYFIADLPAGASLSARLITEACETLKRNREQYLLDRSTRSLVSLLAKIAAEWLDNASPFRRLALEQGAQATGFSRATVSRGLDSFFCQLTVENLEALIVQDLGHERRLDFMTRSDRERRQITSALARGPELLVHIAAGNLPSATLMSIVLGILTRSAQFVKCARGASLIPRLFAHSLYEVDRKLCSCLELAEWPGGETTLENALFNEADCVTVTGSDETLMSIRQRLSPRVRFLGYGHRVSFGYLARELMTSYELDRIATRAAADVMAWDQLGCLSPHLFYVETGGAIAPESFAAHLADALVRGETEQPRGPVPLEVAATIAHRRAFYEVRAAGSPETKLWCSPGSTAWTVVYEADPLFQLSCLHRFIYVKGVKDVTEALHAADRVHGQVSTVGLAAPDLRAPELALQLARWGVPRICPLGRMQEPPLTWRHDGRPSLGDLITWTDWEQE